MKLPTISVVVVVVAVCIGLPGLINGSTPEQKIDFLNQMSMKAYEVALQHEQGNFIFSPIGISHLLSIISDGVSGKTLSELETYIPMDRYGISGTNIYKLPVDFFYPIPKWNKNTLNIENKIYLNKKITVRSQCQKFISAISPFRVEHLNFDNTQNSKNTVNSWIQNNIDYCLEESVETDDVANIKGLLLMSIIKFTAGWKYGFAKGTDSGFYLKKGNDIPARFSRGIWPLYMSNNKDLNATIVKLPYQMPYNQRPVSMFIIVPNEIDGLKHVENNIDKINMTTLQDLKLNLVDLYLPNFKLETKIDIKEHLKKMGIKKAFARDAEFFGNCPVHISKIIQKATISVDAEGTGATAASYNDKFESKWSESEDIKEVKVEQPFLVVMVAGDLILFTGRVTNPGKDEDELCSTPRCRVNLDLW